MNPVFKSHLMVLLATFLVSGSFLASAHLAGEINPFSLTLLRFVAAALLLLPAVVMRRAARRRVLATLPRAMGISVFYALFFVCMFEALKTTTSLNIGTLYTLVPFMTALLCRMVLGQRINRSSAAIYFIGAVAAGWVIFEGRVDKIIAFNLNSGDLLFLVGIVLICGYSLAMKLLYRRDDSMLALVFCILLSGGGWMATVMAVNGTPLEWHKLSGSALWAMAYLVVPSTLVTVYLYQRSIVVLGPRRMMAYVYLNPACVALLLWWVEGESIALNVLPAIGLCALATVLLQRQPRPRQ